MVKEEIFSIASALVGGARYGVKIRLPHALVMTFLFRRDLSSKDKIKNVVHLAYQHASSLAAFATIYKTILALLKLAHRKLITDKNHHNTNAATAVARQQGTWKAIGRALFLMIVDGPLPGERRLVNAASSAPPGHPERIHHAFIAGGVGGYFVWGRYSSLNQQIMLYLVSRVLVGLWKRLHHSPQQSSQSQSQLLDMSSRSLSSNQSASTTTTSSTTRTKGSARHSKTFSMAAALVWAVVMALWEESPDLLHPSLKKSMDEIYRYSFREPSLIYDEVEPPLESRNVQD